MLTCLLTDLGKNKHSFFVTGISTIAFPLPLISSNRHFVMHFYGSETYMTKHAVFDIQLWNAFGKCSAVGLLREKAIYLLGFFEIGKTFD